MPSVLITYRVVLIRVHTHPERENIVALTFAEKHLIAGRERNKCTALRYAHEGQHGRGAPPTDPHSEEDNQQGG